MATLLVVLLTLTIGLTGCGSEFTKLDKERLENQVKIQEEQLNMYKEDEDKLKDENAELRATIDSLTADNNKLKQKIDAITEKSESNSSTDQQTINNLTKQVEDLKKQLEDAYNNTSSSSYPELQNRINVLTLDLENHKKLVDTLNQQLADQIASNSQSSSTATSSYLAIKFWSDGNTYTANVKWYSDPNCIKSAGSNITITSPVVSQDKLSNGYTVYTCMSTNGLVYSSQYPYLTKNK